MSLDRRKLFLFLIISKLFIKIDVIVIRASFCYSPKSLSIAYETGHNNNDGREQYFLALIIQNFNLFPLSLQ